MSKTNKDQSPFHGIFEGCTKEQKTQLGVAHAVLHYTKLGYIVCFPPPDTQGVGWDLLACKPNETPIKIQVKTTGQQVGKSGYYAVGLKMVIMQKTMTVWMERHVEKQLETLMSCLHLLLMALILFGQWMNYQVTNIQCI